MYEKYLYIQTRLNHATASDNIVTLEDYKVEILK